MINIYKTDENMEFKKINEIERESWIDLINPTNEEIKSIADITNTDLDLLMKLTDDEELPRIEVGENATLIVVDTPYITDARYKHKYNTDPLGIIINNDGYFITISLKKQTFLDDFKKNKIKHFDIRKRTKFVIQILLRVSSVYQRELISINNYINKKEKMLYKSTNNKELIDLLNIEKTLVYFSTSLKANDAVLEKLSKGNILTLYEDDNDLMEDAIIENKLVDVSNYEEIRDFMMKWFTKRSINEEVVKLGKKLKSNGYNIYILSNMASCTYEYIKDQDDFFSIVDGTVVSAYEKVKKPDKKIFKILLERYNLNATECLLIDDDDTNKTLEVANSFGIKGRKVLPNDVKDIKKLLEENEIKA